MAQYVTKISLVKLLTVLSDKSIPYISDASTSEIVSSLQYVSRTPADSSL